MKVHCYYPLQDAGFLISLHTLDLFITVPQASCPLTISDDLVIQPIRDWINAKTAPCTFCVHCFVEISGAAISLCFNETRKAKIKS